MQPTSGYRLNVDSLILAAFAAERRPVARSVVDLGAGVGGLSLAFSRFGKGGQFHLIERDPSLLELAAANLAAARLDGKLHRADLAEDGLPSTLLAVADVVISNPPFFTPTASSSGDAARRAARSGPLDPFLWAARQALGRRARAFLVYPADALVELVAKARQAGLVAKRLRFVHAFAHSTARLSLVELANAKPGGLVIDPPLVEWASRGVRSPELDALVSGRVLQREAQ